MTKRLKLVSAVAQKRVSGGSTTFRNEFCGLVRDLALLGVTEQRIASLLGVHSMTLAGWKNQFPQFKQALDDGKELADAQVAAALYQRATGFTRKENKTVVSNGVATTVEVEQYYPPDVTAAVFWLRNRHPEAWRERKELAVGPTEAWRVPPNLTIEQKKQALLAIETLLERDGPPTIDIPAQRTEEGSGGS